MTDEERRNRNPAVEVVPITLAEIEAMPIVRAAELELRKVYVIQTARHVATLNYMGTTLKMNPVTLDTVKVHHFHAPRIPLNVFIHATPDGSFADAVGTRITIRRWMGEDQ
jgi:hypothetical protein